MPTHPVRTYLSDEAMDWIRAMLGRALERYGKPATDAAVLRACVEVGRAHEDEVIAALADDLGYQRKGTTE